MPFSRDVSNKLGFHTVPYVERIHTVPYCQSMATLNRDDWSFAGAKLLAERGPEGVKVEPLAAALGVSKGSFYWHFKDRDDLLTSILDMWERHGTDAIVAAVRDHHGSPRERVAALVDQVCAQPEHDAMELAIHSWARADARAAHVASRVDTARLRFVVSLLVDAGIPSDAARERAELFYRALLGEFMLRSQGHPAWDAADRERIVAALVAP